MVDFYWFIIHNHDSSFVHLFSIQHSLEGWKIFRFKVENTKNPIMNHSQYSFKLIINTSFWRNNTSSFVDCTIMFWKSCHNEIFNFTEKNLSTFLLKVFRFLKRKSFFWLTLFDIEGLENLVVSSIIYQISFFLQNSSIINYGNDTKYKFFGQFFLSGVACTSFEYEFYLCNDYPLTAKRKLFILRNKLNFLSLHMFKMKIFE